jgi:DNA-binding transcriptional regulator/RsmH inhibitor MraZ
MPEESTIVQQIIRTIFTGEQDVTLDSQDRVIIPSYLVDQGLVDIVYIVPRGTGIYKCLALMTVETFNTDFGAYTLRGDVKEGDFQNRGRLLFPGISRQKLNATKPRITLSEKMVSHLFDDDDPIKGEIFTVIGIGIGVELWRRKVYDKWCKHEKPKVEEWFLQQTSGVTNQ